MRNAILCTAITLVLAGHSGLNAKGTSTLKPLLAVPNAIVLKEDFSKAKPLKKGVWQSRQGTRWTIEDGVLRGRESSAEFQAKRKDHFGYEPRLSIPVTPTEFVASFSFRFLEGKETAIVPFIEFGHHVCRVRFSKDGTSVLSDGETMKLAEASEFVWHPGNWYHALAEMKGNEFVMQIDNGPTLYALRDSFANSPTAGGNGFGVAGPKNGLVELDNMTIWSVKPKTQPGWAKHKEDFAKFEPVQVKEPKKKKSEQKKANPKANKTKK